MIHSLSRSRERGLLDHRHGVARHIDGDFLLIYRLEGDAIIFGRAGTHSELFED